MSISSKCKDPCSLKQYGREEWAAQDLPLIYFQKNKNKKNPNNNKNSTFSQVLVIKVHSISCTSLSYFWRNTSITQPINDNLSFYLSSCTGQWPASKILQESYDLAVMRSPSYINHEFDINSGSKLTNNNISIIERRQTTSVVFFIYAPHPEAGTHTHTPQRAEKDICYMPDKISSCCWCQNNVECTCVALLFQTLQPHKAYEDFIKPFSAKLIRHFHTRTANKYESRPSRKASRAAQYFICLCLK